METASLCGPRSGLAMPDRLYGYERTMVEGEGGGVCMCVENR